MKLLNNWLVVPPMNYGTVDPQLSESHSYIIRINDIHIIVGVHQIELTGHH